MWFCCQVIPSNVKSCFGPIDVMKTWHSWSHVVHPSKNSTTSKNFVDQVTTEDYSAAHSLYLQRHLSNQIRVPSVNYPAHHSVAQHNAAAHNFDMDGAPPPPRPPTGEDTETDEDEYHPLCGHHAHEEDDFSLLRRIPQRAYNSTGALPRVRFNNTGTVPLPPRFAMARGSGARRRLPGVAAPMPNLEPSLSSPRRLPPRFQPRVQLPPSPHEYRYAPSCSFQRDDYASASNPPLDVVIEWDSDEHRSDQELRARRRANDSSEESARSNLSRFQESEDDDFWRHRPPPPCPDANGQDPPRRVRRYNYTSRAEEAQYRELWDLRRSLEQHEINKRNAGEEIDNEDEEAVEGAQAVVNDPRELEGAYGGYDINEPRQSPDAMSISSPEKSSYESRRQYYQSVFNKKQPRRLSTPEHTTTTTSIESMDEGSSGEANRTSQNVTSFDSMTDNAESAGEGQAHRLRNLRSDSGYKSFENPARPPKLSEKQLHLAESRDMEDVPADKQGAAEGSNVKEEDDDEDEGIGGARALSPTMEASDSIQANSSSWDDQPDNKQPSACKKRREFGRENGSSGSKNFIGAENDFRSSGGSRQVESSIMHTLGPSSAAETIVTTCPGGNSIKTVLLSKPSHRPSQITTTSHSKSILVPISKPPIPVLNPDNEQYKNIPQGFLPTFTTTDQGGVEVQAVVPAVLYAAAHPHLPIPPVISSIPDEERDFSIDFTSDYLFREFSSCCGGVACNNPTHVRSRYRRFHQRLHRNLGELEVSIHYRKNKISQECIDEERPQQIITQIPQIRIADDVSSSQH